MAVLAQGCETRVLGYLHVSTDEQASSRAGLEAQRQPIERPACSAAGRLVNALADAGYSAKNLRWPGIQPALAALRAGAAEALSSERSLAIER
jgi:DNA invertase Pin-like site-specific DNA recombinase